MSVLVIGISHKSAPVSLLEQLALDEDAVRKLVLRTLDVEHVGEATVLATCNRVEIYTEVDRFHGSVEALSRLLCERGDARAEDVVPYLYVHYDDGAVAHLFHVAAGLDSMVVGEGQILSQTREALRLGQELGAAGPALNVLFQQALRVAKRTHAETDIDRAAPSLVSAALERAVVHLGPLTGRRALVVGAGAMASLSVATLTRMGVHDVAVVNRDPARAVRLAQQYDGRASTWERLPALLGDVDLIVSCTGATGTVLDATTLEAARRGDTTPLVVVDLALPHDVEPEVELLPGVTLIGLARLAEELEHSAVAGGVDQVRAIVGQEVAAFLTARRSASVTPTVVALRSMATSVVDAEVARLVSRLPDLDPATRFEVEQTVRRVADKLLHQPTVRVKELANETGAVSYAAALAELFALDPDAVDAVTRVEGVNP
ncbi:MAG: glutamyl-tRNA reductase [Nocardioides sp.]|nr:glutamyl-tRNA reductase [Nocardioides sp.]